MSTATPVDLRERCIAFLAAHRLAILSLAGPEGAWAMPVPCATRDLTIGCLLPRWAEIEFRLEGDPAVLLVVPDAPEARRWLAVRGRGGVVASGWDELLPLREGPLQSSELYTIVEVTPSRLDLIDERAGWGRRETLDL